MLNERPLGRKKVFETYEVTDDNLNNKSKYKYPRGLWWDLQSQKPPGKWVYMCVGVCTYMYMNAYIHTYRKHLRPLL